MHEILLEEGHKSTIKQQRCLNPIINEVVKKEIFKWVDVEIIYPIADSSWVSLDQCQNYELISSRIVNKWRVCMDIGSKTWPQGRTTFLYHLLTRCLIGYLYKYIIVSSMVTLIQLDKNSSWRWGENHIHIFIWNLFFQKNAFWIVLCSRNILKIHGDHSLRYDGGWDGNFMDDFSIFGSTFDQFLETLHNVFKRCESVNLVWNWEKCHFMVIKRVMLRHKVSSKVYWRWTSQK